MKLATKLHLREKGWGEKEVTHAEEVLERTAHYDKHFSKMVFWSALLVIIFGNIVISLILIPFLIVLNQWILYALLVVLAGIAGFLYNFLITDIGHLEWKHHLWAAIIVPLVALTNMLVMVAISNRFITDLQVQNPPHNIWIVAAVFAVVFVLPYVVSRVRMTVGGRKVIAQ